MKDTTDRTEHYIIGQCMSKTQEDIYKECRTVQNSAGHRVPSCSVESAPRLDHICTCMADLVLDSLLLNP